MTTRKQAVQELQERVAAEEPELAQAVVVDEVRADTADTPEVTAPLDLEQPAELDAAWVALGAPSGTITREYVRDAGWDALPEPIQDEAIAILETQEG